MRETWYILENGEVADPADVVLDGNCYRHKDGVAVAMRGDTPSSRSVDPEEERANAAKRHEKKTKEPVADGVKPKTENREIVSEEPKKTYANREVKSR